MPGSQTLTAVELVYEQAPGYAIPALQRKAVELLGLQPHPAPSLAWPGKEPAPPAATAA